jgi:transposase-like protein
MVDLTFAPHIEILSAEDVPRRRHWSDAEKIRLVEESYLGHRQVSATARRHGISRGLLTVWRRSLLMSRRPSSSTRHQRCRAPVTGNVALQKPWQELLDRFRLAQIVGQDAGREGNLVFNRAPIPHARHRHRTNAGHHLALRQVTMTNQTRPPVLSLEKAAMSVASSA